jgi:hypothetical protein
MIDPSEIDVVVKLPHELDDLETSKRLTYSAMKRWTSSSAGCFNAR